MPAATVATAVAAAATIGGSVISSNASQSASKMQAGAADRATQLQSDIYNQNRSDLAPWRETGSNALAMLASALGLPGRSSTQSGGSNGAAPSGPTAGMIAARAAGPHSQNPLNALALGPVAGGLLRSNASPIQDIAGALRQGRTITDAQWAQAGYGPGGADPNAAQNPTQGDPNNAPAMDARTAFQTSPGYGFAFDQGQQAVDRSAAARGMLRSGAQIKEQTRFGQGIANQEYGGWINNLKTLAGFGQNANQQQQQSGQAYATNSGNLMQDAAAARASGYAGSANAWSGAGNSLAKLAGTYMQNDWGFPGSVNVTPGKF